MLITEALDRYLMQLQADGRSHHTIAQARRHVRLFAAWWGDRPVEDVRHEDAARFLASAVACRRADGAPRKPASGNALRSSLKTFFAYVHGAGYAPTNAARLVRRARCGPRAPRALSDADRERLVAALAQAKTPAELRDRALFMTLLTTGIRIGSALAAFVGDLDLEAGELRLRQQKNGGESVVFVPRQTCALLREHLAGRTQGPLFPSVRTGALGSRTARRRLGEWATRAGTSRAVSPHALRHSFAMWVYARTDDLLMTSRALCHRSIVSTTVYARCDEVRLREVLESS